jgi:heat shock protein HslJ
MKSVLTTASVVTFALLLSACGNDSGGASGPGAPAVDGKTYVGDTVTIDRAAHALVRGTTLRMSFDDGRISASAGCNSMSGSATWDDGILQVDQGALATTEMACEPAMMKQETWFATLLTSQPGLATDGDSLTLTDGTTVVSLTDEEVAVPDASFTETRWVLDSIVQGDAVSSLPQGVHAEITFTGDGTFTAQLGCNRGSGNYTLSDDVLEIGSMATTKMACEQPASQIESAMTSVLNGTLTVSIDGNLLTLTPNEAKDDEPTALSFRAA